MKEFLLFLLLLTLGGTIMSAENHQKTGNKKTGYIYLPKKFMTFTSMNSNSLRLQDIQKSDGKTIFTLNVMEDKNHTVETAASAIAHQFESLGVQNIQGTPITLDGLQGLYIYGDYNENRNKIVSYILPNGENLSLITFEGPIEDLNANLGYIETFSKE
ncbi:hypothetical protein NRK67_03900 [Fusobacteria bacterium ZRK30]|nr:hypothetical protein NRK67_03900 [Fusobacteria bacterium ZRK30]